MKDTPCGFEQAHFSRSIRRYVCSAWYRLIALRPQGIGTTFDRLRYRRGQGLKMNWPARPPPICPPTQGGAVLFLPEDVMPEPTEKEIMNRAYEIWERHGRPEGREDEFW